VSAISHLTRRGGPARDHSRSRDDADLPAARPDNVSIGLWGAGRRFTWTDADKLIGGDHFWYANPMNVIGQLPFNPRVTGATGLTTNDILWSFFAAHSR
jgi:hypothetical protein